MISRRLSALLATAALAAAAPATAEVTRFEIVSRGPAFQGRSFGAAGPVEMIVGRATFAVDPANPHNQVIADLAQAPRAANGRVEATTDVVILRPRAAAGPLLVELPNRGRVLAIGWMHDAGGSPPGPPSFKDAADAGNGFLFERGVTLVEVGWQGDIRPADGVGMRPPVIAGLTGPARELWTFAEPAPVVRAKLSYPAASPGPAAGKLTVHVTPDAPATSPAGLAFRLVDPTTIEITRPAGLGPRAVYEFNYTATDPAVMGMGFAAVRDVAAFLKFDKTAANPLAASGLPAKAIGLGISQSGRALRDFLYQGFNADEQDRQVFDGMLPVVPGARRSFTNARFAQPGRNPGPQADRLYPIAQFPFAYEATQDPPTGRTDGVLSPCRASKTCPKVIQVDSEYEFWGSQAALNVITPTGQPLPLPPEVRAFMVAGAPHAAAGPTPSQASPACLLSSSPVQWSSLLRALFVGLDQWLGGVQPPASRYPLIPDGALVPPDQAFPPIVPLPYRRQFARAYHVDQTAAGPVIRGAYPVLVPRAGPDGNAIGGVRLPMVAAPRATYTGWNPLRGASGAEDLCTQQGGALPFAPSDAEALMADDSRRSIEELYPTPESYVAKVKAAADELVAARLLLPADAAADVRAAQAGTLAGLGTGR